MHSHLEDAPQEEGKRRPKQPKTKLAGAFASDAAESGLT